MSGEAQSRTEIVIPEPQQQLAEAVAAVGKPIVVVLKHGRALALQGAVANAQAILATWFLGTETGNAIADVLFGAYSPSARLPASFPRASGQEPYYYAHKPTGRPNPPGDLQPYKAHFRGIPNSALYPFGHGLTYGKIAYSGMSMIRAPVTSAAATTSKLAATGSPMVDQLNAFASEVTRVAREVGTEGSLGGQAQVPGVGGTWKDLTDNVNLMATNLTNQVRGIAEVVTAVAQGNLKRKLTLDAKGEIAALADTINFMARLRRPSAAGARPDEPDHQCARRDA